MDDLAKVFDRAATNVVVIWPNVVEKDDLVQELWVWAAERPSVTRILDEKPAEEVYKFVSRHAHQIAADQFERNVRFGAKYEYSIDVTKGILKGSITGVQAVNDLAVAIENVGEGNTRYGELIRRRYYTEGAEFTHAEREALRQAHIRLTDEMNRVARLRSENLVASPGKSLGDGPGAPKLNPISITEETAEPRPNAGWYDARASRPNSWDEVIERYSKWSGRDPDDFDMKDEGFSLFARRWEAVRSRFPAKSLRELQKTDPSYPFNHRY